MPSRSVYNRATSCRNSLIVAMRRVVVQRVLRRPRRSGAGLTEARAPRRPSTTRSCAARFDAAPHGHARACPPAPREACQALATVGAVVADSARSGQPRARRAARTGGRRRAIASAEPLDEARAADAPKRGSTSPASYAPLVAVAGPARRAAARPRATASEIKDALERALALDPTLHDAYFGIGLYHYYADVAPAALKVAALAAAAAGRRSRAGPAGDAAGARSRRDCSAAKPTTSCTGCISGTSISRRARSTCCAVSTRGIRPIRCSSSASPKSQRDYLHDHAASARDIWRRCSIARAADASEFAAMTRGARADRPRAGAGRRNRDAARAIDALIAVIAVACRRRRTASLALARLTLGRAYERLGDRERAMTRSTTRSRAAPSDDPDDDSIDVRAPHSRDVRSTTLHH